MRVALVYPEVLDLARFKENRKEFPPFGVLYLAAVAEQAGHEVKVIKVSNGDHVRDFSGLDVVAFTIPSSATYGIIRDCRRDSQYDGDPLVLAGGVHPNFYPEQTLLDIEPDVVGVGEGEETFLQLIAQARTRRFGDVGGVCYRHGGQTVRTPSRPLLKSIDTLPLPARHLLPAEDLVMADRLSNTDLSMAHVMFSRGCPFPCRFCAAAQTRIQYRSGASARRELVGMIERYGIEGFAIVDDNFIVNKNKVRDICTSISDLSLKWSALSRVDTVDEALLVDMARAGCLEVKYGMESGSPKVLKAMKKNITADHIRRAVRWTRAAGINVKLFLIHGFPGEDRQTTEETMELLAELGPDVERASLFRFVPLPGTYVYDHPEEFDLHGTSHQAGWSGDWGQYHIHHNDKHWWGTEEQFDEVQAGYEALSALVEELWPDRHQLTPSAPAA
ncbi:B12-binding domain-containing radical SAM protein [Streptomyces griseocarneus]|uniref:B12-binding domain-containing radical SAM protein n=1 Tax=Streptomyces griseocarneus TaxID=51201 RepID=UPI00167C5950|nr:radical SAM protein [Streptomyces griseocarneus]MBZ6476710.1 B12-binding domain-containing radical SAM protein [Streptomyces griseocarneus]GHG80472.1 B12-binding domain-containing radical SAM protein [Streptomyces griseocarneus]